MIAMRHHWRFCSSSSGGGVGAGSEVKEGWNEINSCKPGAVVY
jgi:hypothetical protein